MLSVALQLSINAAHSPSSTKRSHADIVRMNSPHHAKAAACSSARQIFTTRISHSADTLFAEAQQLYFSDDQLQKDKAIESYKEFLKCFGDDWRHIDARINLANLLTMKVDEKGKGKPLCDKIKNILMPIIETAGASNIDPSWLATKQCDAWKMMAIQYKFDKKETKELRALFNLLATAANNNWYTADGNLFPLHEPEIITNIARLLRRPKHMHTFEKWIETDISAIEDNKTTRPLNKEERDAFIEQLLEYAHIYGSKDGRTLLAHRLLKKGKYAQSADLFQLLLRDGNDDVEVQALVSQWLSGDQCNEKMISMCQDGAKQAKVWQVIQTFGTQEHHKKWWKIIFDNRSGAQRCQAAYHLIEREENETIASIYRNIALSNPDAFTPEQLFTMHPHVKDPKKATELIISMAKKGHPEACNVAFKTAKKISIKEDQKTYAVLLEAAALGGHAKAQLMYGIYWKNKIEEAVIKKDRTAVNQARQNAIKWLSLASKTYDLAYLEKATIAENMAEAIKQVLPFAQNKKFSLCVEAQLILAEQYKIYALQLAKEKPRSRLKVKHIQQQYTKMLQWHKIAAQSGNIDAMYAYAEELLLNTRETDRKKDIKYQTGKDLCDSILKKDSHHMETRILLGRHALKLHQYTCAGEYLTAAYAIDTNDDLLNETINALIFEFTRQDQYQDAQHFLEHLLAINNENPHHHVDLAYCYKKNGDIASALQHYDQAGQLGAASGYYNIASCYFIGNLIEQSVEEAQKYAQFALEIDPKHCKTLNLLAKICAQQGDDLGSVEYLKKCAYAHDAEGCAEFAQSLLSGLGGKQDRETASRYFNLAARSFNAQGDIHQSLECQALGDIIRLQLTDILDNCDPEDLKEKHLTIQKEIQCKRKHYLQEFSLLAVQSISDKQKEAVIKKISNIDSACNVAFAIQCEKMGDMIKDEKVAYYYQAIEHLKKAQLKNNLQNALLLAQITLEVVPKSPYEQLSEDQQEMIDVAQEKFSSVIEIASKQPHNALLPTAYSGMGIIQRFIHQDVAKAKELFLTGIKEHNSIPCHLNLASLMHLSDFRIETIANYVIKAHILATTSNNHLYDRQIETQLKKLSDLQYPLAQIHYGIMLKERGKDDEAEHIFDTLNKSEDTEVLKLLATTYNTLGYDLEAHNITEKFALTKDPEALATLANYYHIGYANKYDINKASELYGQAAQAYAAQGDEKEAEECKILALITAYQAPECLSGMSLTERTVTFDRKESELNTIIETHKDIPESSVIAHQARLALSSLFYNMGAADEDPKKKNYYIEQSLECLAQLPPSMIAGLYNRGMILYEFYLQPLSKKLEATPYDKIDSSIQIIAQKCRTIFERILELDNTQPHNFFLLRSYAQLGKMLKMIFDDETAAKETFAKGAQKKHAPSMSLLARVQLFTSNNEEDLKVARKTAIEAIQEAKKSGNEELVAYAQETLAQIIGTITKTAPPTRAAASSSSACSSSARAQP